MKTDTDNTHNEFNLHLYVEQAVTQYYHDLKPEDMVTNLYEIFIKEIERPLLVATLHYTHGNQSKSAEILGLNRGTLRTKLKQHGLI